MTMNLCILAREVKVYNIKFDYINYMSSVEQTTGARTRYATIDFQVRT
jgi:hypothetical protein